MASDTPQFFAVRGGKSSGVYASWDECKTHLASVETKVEFEKFDSDYEAYQYIHRCGTHAPAPKTAAKSRSPSRGRTGKPHGDSRKSNANGYSKDGEKFYAVVRGYNPGIYRTMQESKDQTLGFDSPYYKVFGTLADAEKFMDLQSKGRTPSRKPESRATPSSGPKKAGPSKTKKWYAVQAGHIPGVYETWPACQEQTNGFKNAVFRSFESKEDAERFAAVDAVKYDGPYYYRLFTDGSYKDDTAGYGSAVYQDNVLVATSYGPVKDTTNNAAELMAILSGLSLIDDLTEKGVTTKTLEIIPDSKYSMDTVEAHYPEWTEAERKAAPNAKCIKSIVETLAEMRAEGWTITFTHIDSHQKSDDPDSDISHNNHVDTLADKGRGEKKRVADIF